MYYVQVQVDGPSGSNFYYNGVVDGQCQLEEIGQISVTIPTGVEPGIWNISYIRVEDCQGNQTLVYESELIDLGFNIEFEVINNPIPCNEEFGDMNGDSNIDVIDIIWIVNYILYDFDDSYDECFDLNEDGTIDIIDIINLINIILDM